MNLLVGVVRAGGDTRVALVPQHVKRLSGLNVRVVCEEGCGTEAGYSDQQYKEAGAEVLSRAEVLSSADVIVSTNLLDSTDTKQIKEGALVVGLSWALWYPEVLLPFAQRGLSVYALDFIPRITRAQSMDVLSSQATVAGYGAVVLAATRIPRLIPMMSTAAGTVSPVEALVIGAGVAGLQAIATARKLGAKVYAFDVRSAVKEQVESLGAQFVAVEGARTEERGGYAVEQSEEFLQRQQEVIASYARRSSIVITTASVPGRRSPLLITKQAVKQMPWGSVIVDIAAQFGGNCELTQNGKEITTDNGVLVIGDSNIPGRFPQTASYLFSGNIVNLLEHLVREGKLFLNMEDELVSKALIVYNGNITHPQLKEHTAKRTYS